MKEQITLKEVLERRNNLLKDKKSIEHKQYAGLVTKSSIDEENYTVKAVVTDESVDSFHENIKTSAWKKRIDRYASHPVLIGSHDSYDLMKNIGKAVDWKFSTKNKNMTVTFQYFVGKGNPTADWAWFLVTQNLAAYSVGFRWYDFEVNEDFDEDAFKAGNVPFITFTDVELFEISQVLVPANKNGLQKSLESDDPFTRDLAKTIQQKNYDIDTKIIKSYEKELPTDTAFSKLDACLQKFAKVKQGDQEEIPSENEEAETNSEKQGKSTNVENEKVEEKESEKAETDDQTIYVGDLLDVEELQNSLKSLETKMDVILDMLNTKEVELAAEAEETFDAELLRMGDLLKNWAKSYKENSEQS